MPEYKIHVEDAGAELDWKGEASSVHEAIHRAAKRAGQVWEVRTNTPIPDMKAGGVLRLWADDTAIKPGAVKSEEDYKRLDVLPLIYDGMGFFQVCLFMQPVKPNGSAPVRVYGKE